MLYSIVGLLVIILDQAVKFWVSDTLFGTDVVRFIPGVLSLVNVHNDGAAFSFLSGQGARIYFIVATGLFVVLVIIALATNFIRGKFSRWCLVLVAAGGLGNMIDRVIYGYVQDMFKVELFNFAIFNVADVFITVGAILFALSMFFEKPESDLNDVLYEEDDEEEGSKKKKLTRKERKAAKEAEKAAKEAEKAAARAAKNGGDAPTPALAAVEEPVKKSAVRSARKSRQEKYEQEYEQYKAQQRAAMEKAAEKKESAPGADAFGKLQAAQKKAGGPDPFAAWEQANARAEESEAASYAGRLMDAPRTVSARPAAAQPAPRPQAAPPAAPAPQEAPKPAAPAPKPTAPAKEEFSLDEILAEFK